MEPTRFFKSLADPTRLKILLLIHQEEELCVCELMAALSEIQPKVSRNLALLKSAGILQDRRQGQWVFYRLHPQLPAWALQVLAATFADNSGFIDSSLRNLTSMGERPARARQCC